MENLSRRNFLGASAGTLGAASLGGAFTVAATAAAEEEKKPEKRMKVGMLTAPFDEEPFDGILDFAKSAGIACCEVVADLGSKHFDLETFDAAKADALKPKLAERGLEISAFANYSNATEPGKAERIQTIGKKMIDAAVLMNVNTVCMMAGMKVDKLSKIETIKQVIPGVFRPIIDYGKEKGVRIALENWFETCLQGVDTFDCLFETVPDENFGLNYDPSHLFHQQCNHLLPIAHHPKRIFHTHAKDTLVNLEKRAYVGVLGRGWWRYVIPGQGNINWGEYISHLRQNGYIGVMSIEHEDSTFSREGGFIQGARYLNQFC